MLRKIRRIMPVVLVLYATWLVFAGDFGLTTLITGLFVVGLTIAILPVNTLRIFSRRLITRVLFAFVFLLYVFLEVFQASYKLAFYGLWPWVTLSSSIVRYEYTLENKVALFLLSTIITLTPGTLVLELDRAKNRLYIHYLELVTTEVREETWETIRLMENWLRRIFE